MKPRTATQPRGPSVGSVTRFLALFAVLATGCRGEAPVEPVRQLTPFRLTEGQTRLEDLEMLAESPRLKQHDALIATGVPIGDQAVAALARSAYLTNITYIRLTDVGLTDLGLAALSVAHGLRLERLTPSQTDMARGLSLLLDSPAGESLVDLRLRSTRGGDEVAKTIPTSRAAESLVDLAIWMPDLGDDGVRSLVAGDRWAQLKSLELAGCGWRSASLEPLTDSSHMPALEDLTIVHFELAQSVRDALARARPRLEITDRTRPTSCLPGGPAVPADMQRAVPPPIPPTR